MKTYERDVGEVHPTSADVAGEKQPSFRLPERIRSLGPSSLTHPRMQLPCSTKSLLRARNRDEDFVRQARLPSRREERHDLGFLTVLLDFGVDEGVEDGEVRLDGRDEGVLSDVQVSVDFFRLDGADVRVSREQDEALDLHDGGRDGRGEEQSLTRLSAAVGEEGEDALDVGTETHVEETVGFVEDEEADLVEGEVAALEVVFEATGSGDEDVAALLLEPVALGVDAASSRQLCGRLVEGRQDLLRASVDGLHSERRPFEQGPALGRDLRANPSPLVTVDLLIIDAPAWPALESET